MNAGAELGTASSVILLTPSHGLGGGIERYVETLEWAFREQGIACRRIDLRYPSAYFHLRLVADCKAALAVDACSAQLVVVHQSLMPAAAMIAREASIRGISVICHGSEVWNKRGNWRRILERDLMRRANVRVVAASSYTAGALGARRNATILPPSLSQGWFEKLVNASDSVSKDTGGIQITTAFRLASFREKGLPELLKAVTLLNRSDVRLTVCGTGEAPPELKQLIAAHDRCKLASGLTDTDLARQLASANLFVLATRTRSGRQPSGEGFGLALLEAQVAGTPVIAPAHGGSADAFSAGVTGAAPTDESVGKLVEVLAELLADPARLRWMGKRAGEWARESFSPRDYSRTVIRRLL
jgi:glycosyltransferase involved in cell wall biosynthesis